MKIHASSIEALEARIAPASFRWNLAGNGNWNSAASWFNETTGTANNGFPNAVDDVAKFLSAITVNVVVTIAGVNVTAGVLIFDDNNNYNIAASGGGTLTLNGATGATITLPATNAAAHAISAPLTLGSALTFDNSSASPFNFNGTITDGGVGRAFTKNGTGTVSLLPPSANSLLGTTMVNAGTLALPGPGALSGTVIVGGAGSSAQLSATFANALADTTAITVNALGTFTATGNDTIGALTINDGTVSLGAGAASALTVASLAMTGGTVQLNIGKSLILGGNLTAAPSATQTAQILDGTLSWPGGARTFDVGTGPATPALTVTASINGGSQGALLKTGAGALQMAGTTSNSIASGVTVNEGLLLLSKTSGNAVGTLTIGDGLGGAEADGVRLFGANQIANGVSVVVNASGLLDLNGNDEQFTTLSITGGRATTGPAAAALTLTNSVTLNAGHIELAADGSRLRLPLGLTVTNGATAGSLIDGRGAIEALGGGWAFTVGNSPDAIDLLVLVPLIGATKTLAKDGAGTLALNATNTYDGGTTVAAPGSLSVGGQIGDVTVNAGATLTGGGTTGAVTVSGFLRPDSLSTGSITASGSPSTTFAFNIDGNTPGDGPGFYDQLAVTGTVDLNNATFAITGSADFAPNQQVVLIANDGVDAISGTFNSFPEGSSVFVEGRGYLLSYAGGDGNDVVLTPFQYRVFEGGTLPDSDDIFVVRRDAADPKLLHITVQSSFLSTIVDVSLNEFAGVLFRGGAGNDTLVFDGEQGYFNSGFQFVDEIIFDGGSGTNGLRLNGAAALGVVESVNYIPAGADGGSANFSNQFSVAFDGVSEFFSGIATTRFEFSGTIGAPDEIALLPGAFPEDVVIAVPGQVPVTLRNQPLINLNGGGGADRYHVGTFAAAAGLANVTVNHFGTALATLTVAGGTGADTFTLNSTTRTITSTGQPTITYEDPIATIFDGGAGNDLLQITTGSALGTTFLGGPGTDGLSFANSTAAVGFNADRLGGSQTLNGLGWELTLGDLVESFTGSPAADQITIAPGTTPRFVDDPNGTATLILDGLGSALTINGPLLNNATGTVTLDGLADPTLNYGNIGVIRTIHVPGNATPAFGTAGNTFAAPLDFTTGKGAISVATGDLNGDGRADFVTADSKAGTISIALSTPLGLLLPAVQKLTGGVKPAGVVIGNFDGANGPDIAVTNAGSGNIAIFLNDGTGNFGNATAFPAGKTPGVLRAGDLDGDNDPDLATIIAGNKLAILKGNGDGTFAAATTLATGAVKPRDFALADLDGDTDLDLAVLHTGGQLATRVNDGTATFAAPVIAKAGAGATALAIADFNGDGRADIAVTHATLSRFVAVLLGKGDATFLPALRIAYSTGAKASAIVASDFDGDGRADLAIANGAGGRVSILRGLGTGGFARALDLTLEDLPPRKLAALALGDFDGDGRTDLAALSGASGEVSIITRA